MRARLLALAFPLLLVFAHVARAEGLDRFTFAGKTFDVPSLLGPGYWLKSMVDTKDQSLYLVESTAAGVQLNRFAFDGRRWDEGTRETVLEFGKRSFWTPAFDAGRNKFYLVTDQGMEETFNVYAVDLAGKQIKRLTSLGYVPSFALAKDASLMAFLGRKDKNVEAACLYTLDLAHPERGEQLEHCDTGDLNPYVYDAPQLSEDGREVAYEQLVGNDRNKRRLVVFNRDTRTVRVLLDESVRRGHLRVLGWVDGRIVYTDNAGTNVTNLYSIAADGSDVRLLYQAEHVTLEASLDPETKLVLMEDYEDVNHGNFVAYDLRTAKVVAKAPSGGYSTNWYNGLMPLGDGRYAFRSAAAETSALELRVWDPKNEPTALQVAFHPSINDRRQTPCESEDVEFPTFDLDPATGKARMIKGVHLRPVADAPLKTRAGFVYAHGGPTGEVTRASISWDMHALCLMGFDVLAANVRGSSGQGQAFEDLNNGDWGGGDLKDYEYARRYMQGTLGIPKERIGITGGSYGGYMTNMAVTRPDNQFAYAVSLYGMADLLLEVRESVVPANTITDLGDPAANEALYRERSPINWVQYMNVPLLVVHGDRDYRVVFEDSRIFTRRLSELGKDVRYVELPGEGHGFQFVDTSAIYLQEQARFLERVLGID